MPKLSFIGYVFIAHIVSYAALFLYGLWTESFSAEWFFKVSVTYAVVLGALTVGFLVKREFTDVQQMKKDKYMD